MKNTSFPIDFSYLFSQKFFTLRTAYFYVTVIPEHIKYHKFADQRRTVMPYFITGDCNGCTACARQCPVLAIDGISKERHVVNIHRCVSCGVCGRVCPQDAVLDGHGNLCKSAPRSTWKKPVVDTALCSACGICVTWCRAEALRIAPPKYRGDIHVSVELFQPNKCVACGLCEENCPVGAIRLPEVNV
jgi:ferredoxin